MNGPLSDTVLAHLRVVADLPDLSGTKYRFIEPIARGGMGTVHLVEDLDLGRRVALKVLRDPDPRGDTVARMLAEARIVARLEHPGIVPIHDVGTLPDGRIIYVMKYVQGTSLNGWLRERPPLATILRTLQRICEAVAFAHSRGVVHCDLKPENIMVGPFGEVLVMDWGIARLLPNVAGRSEAPATHDDERPALMGTPAYMAPELVVDATSTVDEMIDIYALGAILYALLAGHPPYRADSFTALRALHERGTTPLPDPLPGDTPRAVAAICLKAMARDRDGRYANARDVADDIARYLDGLAVSAYRENFVEHALRWLSRHRFIVLLVIAYLLMRFLVAILAGL
jgi:serine/threonine protein kinase